ncbi:hypothetical protein OS493_030921 [Desmophyllum pertusum]|uniref:Uncharacterized protein n=1 Tax=Desmophyllum pertusum TaxID=174260 RepID=A0A9W9ZX73_9CNID|nr:hypothetical protein OS493_030921 [Desmophyllum pertusum]
MGILSLCFLAILATYGPFIQGGYPFVNDPAASDGAAATVMNSVKRLVIAAWIMTSGTLLTRQLGDVN